jgi:hypothetical protein
MQVLTIRAATLTDLPELTRLWHEKMILHQQLDRRFTLMPNADSLWASAATGWLADPDCRIEIACRNDTVVGYAIAWIRPTTPGVIPAYLGHIEDMVIDAHNPRGGIGQELLEALKIWFYEREIQNVVAHVPHFGAVEQAFWRAQGVAQWVDLMRIK